MLEAHHRAHAQVENRIKNLKDTGLSRLPFSDYDANRLWVELVLLASLLLAGLQAMIDDHELPWPSLDGCATRCCTSPPASPATPAV